MLSLKTQGIAIIMLSAVAVILSTTWAVMYLGSVIGIFYASTVNAILVTSIIVGASGLIHNRLAKTP